MKLSAPIYVLKNQAKDLKKTQNIALAEALDRVAMREGFATWSLLASKSASLLPTRYGDVLEFLNAGDLALVAARPGMGKSIFAVGLIAQAIAAGRTGSHLFTLVEREDDARRRLAAYNVSGTNEAKQCRIDCSNDICADYIIATAKDWVQPGSPIVVDYLQVLDEKRINPPLQQQIESLREFAKSSGCILIFVCQVDRAVADRTDPRPTIDDIRLPNPLDLGLFNKIMFLYRESPTADQAEVRFAGADDHRFTVGLDVGRTRFVDAAC